MRGGGRWPGGTVPLVASEMKADRSLPDLCPSRWAKRGGGGGSSLQPLAGWFRQPPPNVPISISMKAASSGRARGMTPGSLKLVRNRVAIANKKRMTAKTGIAGERWIARYRHLE